MLVSNSQPAEDRDTPCKHRWWTGFRWTLYLSEHVWVNTGHLANNIKGSSWSLVSRYGTTSERERERVRKWYYQLQSQLLIHTGIQTTLNQLHAHMHKHKYTKKKDLLLEIILVSWNWVGWIIHTFTLHFPSYMNKYRSRGDIKKQCHTWCHLQKAKKKCN